MSDTNKSLNENWLAAQQSMLKAFFPWASQAATTDDEAKPEAGALETQFSEMRDTWKASVEKWTEFAKEAPQGQLPSADKLREMFTPSSWTRLGSGGLDAALKRVLEGPRYATLWDLDRKTLELQNAVVQYEKDLAAYQAVERKAWNLAFERFAKVMSAQPQPGESRSWRGLTDKWLKVANDALTEVHRSDEFVQAQSRMLRAAADRHLQERKIAEAWCEATHVPTRSEVDELQRLVVELRREVRTLRRTAPTHAAVSPARKTAARRSRASAKQARS